MDIQLPFAADTSLKKEGSILFKCEFENPTGSMKDRAIAVQVAHLINIHIQKAVISSSGNAAISAAFYCKKAEIDLTVFVAPSICREKLIVLKKFPISIKISKKPLSSAQRQSIQTGAYNLKQSKDPFAWQGYSKIAIELVKQQKDIDAVFIPTSGGAMLWGIYLGFKKIGFMPTFHTVQTEKTHPIAQIFDKHFTPRTSSLADGIVAKTTPLAEKIINVIKESKGFGWVISDDDMKKAHMFLNSHDLMCSYEGAAALAALWKSQKRGFRYKNPVVILSGKYYEC